MQKKKKKAVCEFGNIEVKIIDTSLEKVMTLVSKLPRKSVTGDICGGIALLGKKKRMLLKTEISTRDCRPIDSVS